MKTPEQIADEVFKAGMLKESSIKDLMVRSIEADRAQRDIYELIAEQLDERVETIDGLEWGQRAKRAAMAVRSGEHDDLWDRFIGPMLDRMEGGLS